MSKNNITGDNLITKTTTPEYRDGWELLWGNKVGSSVGKFQITDKLIEDVCQSENCDCDGFCTGMCPK